MWSESEVYGPFCWSGSSEAVSGDVLEYSEIPWKLRDMVLYLTLLQYNASECKWWLSWATCETGDLSIEELRNTMQNSEGSGARSKHVWGYYHYIKRCQMPLEHWRSFDEVWSSGRLHMSGGPRSLPGGGVWWEHEMMNENCVGMC
jgi:hypothetical protein